MKTETDKAIEFINRHIADFKERTSNMFEFDEDGCKELIRDAESVITLLQQGKEAKEENITLKKYEVMWKSIVNASKCLIDPKGRKVLKMVVKDIKQGMKESVKYLKGVKDD